MRAMNLTGMDLNCTKTSMSFESTFEKMKLIMAETCLLVILRCVYECTRVPNRMGLGLQNIMMEISFRDCMRMMRGMDLESKHKQVGTHMKVVIKMAINMDMKYLDGVMETARI